MNKEREFFLEKQINLYSILISDPEKSNMNQKERQDLINIKDLYEKYNIEYEDLILQKT